MVKTKTLPAGEPSVAGPVGCRGFTLIELLVVLTLIAVIATLAAPRLDRVAPGVELRAAADALRADLRRARSLAIRDNRDAWVLIDVEQGVWGANGGAAGGEAPRGSEMSIVVAMQERLDDARGRVRFFPDGTSTGGSATLRRGDRAYRVEVDWFDGRVSVHDSGAR